MKIALINHSDTEGGAAKACYRLYKGLSAGGLDCDFWSKTAYHKETKKIGSSFNKISNYQNHISKNYIKKYRTSLSNTLFSFPYSDSQSVIELCSYDVINIHWIEYTLSVEQLELLVSSGKPIVWTLHDEKPFTGGCHYTAGCDGFVNSGCSPCPQLLDPLLLAEKAFDFKNRLLKSANLTIVSPSKWLQQRAQASRIFHGKKVELIPNCIDLNVYSPGNKALSKKSLGIAVDSIVLMFSADFIRTTRKGYDDLLVILYKLKSRKDLRRYLNKIVILLVGRGDSESIPFKVVSLGYVSEDEKMAIAYNAADIFLLPSKEDNLPNTVMEAMSCGLPVVGYDSGGVRDLLNCQTGNLIEKNNILSFCECIAELIMDHNLRANKGRSARDFAASEYAQHFIASKYKRLFESLTDKKTQLSESYSCKWNSFQEEMLGYIDKRKDQLSFEKIKETQVFLNDLSANILLQIEPEGRYAIYGAGTYGLFLSSFFYNQVVAFVDKDKSKHGEHLNNIRVVSPENLSDLKIDGVIVSVLGRETEIRKSLKKVLEENSVELIVYN